MFSHTQTGKWFVVCAFVVSINALLPIRESVDASKQRAHIALAQFPPPRLLPHGLMPYEFMPRAVGNPIPRTGDQKLLVILADFPDRAGLFTGQAWQSVFFGAGGFADYYRQVSYNQLRYTGDIVGLSGGVPVTNSASVAYVRLPNPITFYADGQYGYNVSPGQFPKNNGGVVHDALVSLNNAGFDFAPYANPANHTVENLVVIFAGSTHRYTNDPNNSLEATAYRLTWAGGGTYTSSGGQIFDNFTFCPDQRLNLSLLIAYIGICAHEHGHGLGMLDLYDFSYTTMGVGYVDLMGQGAFGATDGQRPFQFSVFSKEFFGWITPTVFLTGTMTVALAPAENGLNFIRLYPNGNASSSEYFLLENRQPLGFDADWQNPVTVLCPGLLIWHIDQNIVQNYPYAVNTTQLAGSPPHQGVVVVEADGRFDMLHTVNYGACSDTWTVGRTWNATSTPNSRLWDGSDSHLTAIVTGASGGVVTVTLSSTSGMAFLPLTSR